MAERVHRPGSFGFFWGVGVDFLMICFYATQKKIWNPQNGDLEDQCDFQRHDFQVLCQFSGVYC